MGKIQGDRKKFRRRGRSGKGGGGGGGTQSPKDFAQRLKPMCHDLKIIIFVEVESRGGMFIIFYFCFCLLLIFSSNRSVHNC